MTDRAALVTRLRERTPIDGQAHSGDREPGVWFTDRVLLTVKERDDICALAAQEAPATLTQSDRCVCMWNPVDAIRLAVWCPVHDPPQQPIEFLTREQAEARLNAHRSLDDHRAFILAALFPHDGSWT